MLNYSGVKYHDVFNLLTNDTVGPKIKGKIRMMIETGWMVHGCLLYSFPVCVFEMRIEITLKQARKKLEKAAAGSTQLPGTALSTQ